MQNYAKIPNWQIFALFFYFMRKNNTQITDADTINIIMTFFVKDIFTCEKRKVANNLSVNHHYKNHVTLFNNMQN